MLSICQTGARCTATLLHEMKRRGKDCRFGVVSMCIGNLFFLSICSPAPKAQNEILYKNFRTGHLMLFFCISPQALEWVLLQSLKEETPATSYVMPVKLKTTTTFYLKMLFKDKEGISTQ